MLPWRYSNPVEIHFGSGIHEKIGELLGNARALLITTKGASERGIVDSTRRSLKSRLVAVYDEVRPNPTFAALRAAFTAVRGCRCEVIIALGGGSVMDSAKALACMLAADDEHWLEKYVRQGEPPSGDFVPKALVAVPTTAGTGSEVTRWGTIWDFEERQKYSVSHPGLYPRVALLDPQLTRTLSRRETLYGGLDALSHSLEAVWNRNANPVSDHYALTAAQTVLEVLPGVLQDLQNLAGREAMLRASLFAGLAFSNTMTALAHALSYHLTTHYSVPHGLACSFCLPFVLRANFGVDPGRDAVLLAIFEKFGGQPVEGLARFLSDLGVKTRLADYGVSREEGKAMIQRALSAGRGVNNLAGEARVLQIYEQAAGNTI